MIIGASLRHLFGVWLNPYLSAFALGVLIVNVIGCGLAGMLTAFLWHVQATDGYRFFLGGGFLGGFTTFLAFEVDVLIALHVGHYRLAAMIAMMHMLGGIMACVAGFWFGRQLLWA